MTQAVVDMALTRKDEPTQAVAPLPENTILMFERLALSSDVDVDKLQKLIDMQERILDRNAKAAFDAAFAEMQAEIPVIIERGHTDKASYAPLEDVIEPLRPILQKHGFSLSHQSEWPAAGVVKIIGILTHKQGHEKRSEFLTQADTGPGRNAVQALGSAMTYGRRYTTADLLMIVTRKGVDDDGEKAGRKTSKEAPAGYEVWLEDLETVAEEGEAALKAVWEKSRKDFREYLMNNDRQFWGRIKDKSKAVKK